MFMGFDVVQICVCISMLPRNNLPESVKVEVLQNCMVSKFPGVESEAPHLNIYVQNWVVFNLFRA